MMKGINYHKVIGLEVGRPKSEATSVSRLPTPDFCLPTSSFLKRILYCFFISLHLSSFSQQNKIDSLLTLIKKDKEDTTKVNHLLDIGDRLVKSRPDTVMVLANEALLLSKNLIENTNEGGDLWMIAQLDKANALIQIGEAYYYQNNYPLALETYKHEQNELEEIEDLIPKNKLQKAKSTEAKILHKIGLTYYSQSNYADALDAYSNALLIEERIEDKDLISSSSTQCGVIYKVLGNYSKALEYYLKALKMEEDLGNQNDVARLLGNIGGVYYQSADYTKALDYVFRAFQIHEKLGNKRQSALCLGNMGNIYAEQGDYQNALDYKFKELKKYEELGQKQGIVESLGGIGSIYLKQADYNKALQYYLQSVEKAKGGNKAVLALELGGLGLSYVALHKNQEAETCFREAIVLSDSLGLLDHKMQIEKALSELYSKSGKDKFAYEHYKIYDETKDSLYSIEKNKDLTRKELNYEFDKTEAATKAEHEKQIAVEEAYKKKQLIVIWSVIGGMLLLAIILIVIIRSLKITRKQKAEIEKQKEISESQKIIVEEQKLVIEGKQKEIVSSIHYAKRIQKAVITSPAYIKQHLNRDHFILFEPKDIVSGDFYWALQHKNKFYIATSDCTGHGVPGAFMSLLNISFLNEAILKRGIVEPHEILNYIRDEIIKALNQEEAERDQKDGMDAILCCYDFGEMKLHFAAANNPLWLLRNGEITEYKADKMPVGKFNEAIKSFTLQKIDLQKEDIIFTSTDGYGDQFGGPNNKKIGKKTLKNILIANSTKSMHEQKAILFKTFNDWKENEEQIDDVSVIGLKI